MISHTPEQALDRINDTLKQIHIELVIMRKDRQENRTEKQDEYAKEIRRAINEIKEKQYGPTKKIGEIKT